MNDFNEAVLRLDVQEGLGQAYKKAIETENSTQWKQNPIFDEKGKMISNELKPVWNGNYAHVEVTEIIGRSEDVLTISIVSHTLPNLKETVSWYESMGCKVIRTKYKEVPSNES